MPHLPNEIWDQIWLERCKLGFEPRVLQPKWVNDGRFNVPAFHTAQPQEPMTQICRGARNIAAHGFYSRICDDPFTGIGGFWWSENDVLYVDRDFYKMLRIDRKSVFIGRDHITRIAADIGIDDDTDDIAKVLLDWFPKLSQIFFLGYSRLMPVSHFKQLVRPTRKSVAEREDIGRDIRLLGDESASTKSIPITTSYRVYKMSSRQRACYLIFSSLRRGSHKNRTR